MIKPEDIPRFTGNLEVLEKAVGALDADGSGFTSTGSDIHNRFQSLASYYEAPEAEKLFATTAAVQTTGENLGTDVESVARALGEYANEIRPLVARLEQLRSEAIAFVAEAKRGHVLINNWQRDQDKVDKNEELVNGVTATTTAFWEAERTAANKIMALFSCIKYRANDGSNKPDMYGFSAEALKDAELPWGSVEERTFLPGNIDRHIKSFVWDGLIVDNIWGTIQGLGALVGIGADASDTWAALGRVFIGAGDFLQDPLNDRPGGLGDTAIGQQSRKDAKEFAKGLVAWDMWSENPARASATVVFNVLTLGVGPLKAGTAAKAGLGAKAAGTAAKIGELLDPVSATVKAAGAAAPKIAEVTAGLRKAVPGLPDLADGSVRLPDGSILRTVDGELVITKPDGSVTGRAPGEMSAADRAALDDAARDPGRTPAEVGTGSRAPGGTAHAGDGLPPQASHDVPGSGASDSPPVRGGGGHGGAGDGDSGPSAGHDASGPAAGSGGPSPSSSPGGSPNSSVKSWRAEDTVVGTAKGKTLLYPNSRHDLSGVKNGAPDEKNTVILPETKEAVKADIAEIAAGRASFDKVSQRYTVNGRSYVIEPTGRVFPDSGPGLVPLNRVEYTALKHIMRANGDMSKLQVMFSKAPQFRENPQAVEKALALYRRYYS